MRARAVVAALVAGPACAVAAVALAGTGNGSQIWQQAGCGGCHTLAAAGSTGTAGPNLDQLHPSASLVASWVRSGGPSMPSYAGSLSDAQIGALAAYVASVAHSSSSTRPAAKPTGVLRHTTAGMALAGRLLLRTADFGAGWTAGRARAKVATLTCGSFNPSLAGLIERGSAASPSYSGGTAGPFVSQTAYVYATADQAVTLWRRVVGPGLLRCLVESVGSSSAQGVRFTVRGKRTLTLPRLAPRAAGYRVVATAATAAQSITTTVDLIVLGRGRAVTELSFAGIAQPVAPGVELGLARKAARRLLAA